MPSAEIISVYEKEREFPVVDDLGNGKGFRVVRADIIAKEESKKKSGDTLKRSLIRHDPAALARSIIELLPAS